MKHNFYLIYADEIIPMELQIRFDGGIRSGDECRTNEPESRYFIVWHACNLRRNVDDLMNFYRKFLTVTWNLFGKQLQSTDENQFK